MAGRARPIDHLVLPVTTLMLARSRLTSLGFTVAPDARHPFGTGNCCVFFKNRTFLEPITIVDRTAADIAAAEGNFFVKRIKRFTERQGEGFAMVALNSADAGADREDFGKAGIGSGDVFRFARKAVMPAGTEREVGFALAATDDPTSPDAAFFVTQHLAPDALFQDVYVEHPNGALGVAAVTAVAARPQDFRAYLSAATGAAEVGSGDDCVEATVDGHRVAVVTPDAFLARYGVAAPDPRRGMLFAACDLLVPDVERAVGYAGPTALRHEGNVVVPASPGLGAVIAFRKEKDG